MLKSDRNSQKRYTLRVHSSSAAARLLRSCETVFLSGMLITLIGSVVVAEEQKPFSYNDHGKRDPLWRLVSPNGTILNYETDFLISDLTLEGIMGDANGNYLAIVNGRILKEGDAIGQFVAEKIGENSIFLKDSKRKFELKLKKGE